MKNTKKSRCFKKCISVFLIITLVSAFASSFSAGAKETDTSNIKSITLESSNNKSTYLDENNSKVDIAKNIAKRKMRTALPESYDLRDFDRSTSVKNQESNGFCWSFASTASMESSILTKGLENKNSDTLDLSETGNSWYLRTNTNDTSSSIYGDYLYDPSMGAEGGIAEYVADSLSSGFGAYPEELISYSDFDNGYPEAYRYYSDYRLKEFTQLPNDVSLIKQKIMENGAVYYSYNCFPENYYTSNGMETYYDNGTSIYGTEPYSGHAVTVIGWDDNFSKDNFHPECDVKNDGAWLCKNSWGEDYQDNVKDEYKGYFWVSYESCANDISQFEMQGAESFDNVYQHQATGNVYLYSESESGFFSAANVFTANADEKLEQICFSNIDPTDVTTKIYKLNENYTSPVDGELLAEFTTHLDFSGTHCIDVPKDIVLSKGDKFSVVIEGNNLIAKFKEADNTESDIAGKSYISIEENEWIDSADDTGISYAAIKAYTSDLSTDKSVLSTLIKEAEELEIDDKADEALITELNTAISQAEKVLSDETATSNTINNAYCVLKGKCETLDNYTFNINSMDDFLTFINGRVNCKYVELNTDLNFASTDVMNNYEPINFYGKIFDGNGHTIKNLTIDGDNKNNKSGIFDLVKNSVIKDITFDNTYVEGFFSAGIIANEAKDSQFINCNIKNSTVKAVDGMYVALMTGSSNNCTYTDCSVENCTAVGGYIASLLTLDDYGNCTFENLRANDYTLMAHSYACDNMGFECNYNSNNYDTFAAMTVTDDNFTIQELVGEIESLSYNGVELSLVDGIYNIGKTNGTACPDIIFKDCEFTGLCFTVDMQTREITVNGYVGTNPEIVIPDTMFNLPVTALSDKFVLYSGMDNSEVTSISIPDSIKTVSDRYLSDFCNLKSVTVGKGVESIGEFAFGYYEGEDGITKIEGFTIYGYAGTAAENYAIENGFEFIAI
ncbi:MAG: hypothetical protein IJ275_03825 [Ruminococcus sp.]|nr:hypothetical protein [Ruminococcus sp.]